MSNYCLCDTCGQPHWWLDDGDGPMWICEGDPWAFDPKVISDNQTPRDVCIRYRPKEDA